MKRQSILLTKIKRFPITEYCEYIGPDQHKLGDHLVLILMQGMKKRTPYCIIYDDRGSFIFALDINLQLHGYNGYLHPDDLEIIKNGINLLKPQIIKFWNDLDFSIRDFKFSDDIHSFENFKMKSGKSRLIKKSYPFKHNNGLVAKPNEHNFGVNVDITFIQNPESDNPFCLVYVDKTNNTFIINLTDMSLDFYNGDLVENELTIIREKLTLYKSELLTFWYNEDLDPEDCLSFYDYLGRNRR